ncbi:hypothetical protein AALA13_04405 [Lachnospiraceae bacterium 50-23]|jgi:O-antigen/teichoic acid export membrane protein|nr:hypothetical protein IMSAGC015_00448 [Lachnospiraceae bacterium]
MIKEKKKIIIDLLYSIGATGLMNVVIQFVVYPLVNRQIGESGFGNMLFWMGVVSIFAPSYGLAVNNTRLVFPEREKTSNRDYLEILSLFALISVAVVLVLCIFQNSGIVGSCALIYIMVISVFRNYSTVEYRLNLNYKKQFMFYLFLSVGYVLGTIICMFTNTWFGTFIIGETVAILYVALTGGIYDLKKKSTIYRRVLGKKCLILALAYLLTNLMLNLDRIILKYGVSDEAVSQYYVLSLLGKTIAIIGGPLSSVIIGYLSKDNYQLNRKEFGKIVGAMVIVGSVFLTITSIVTPVFIKILYPNLYAGIKGLNVIINAAQIFYFLTTLLLVIVLTVCDTKWQLRIQISYSGLFLITAIVFTMWGGLKGFAVAAFVSNICYFIGTFFVGMRFAK